MQNYKKYLKKVPFFKDKDITYQLDSLTGVLQRGIIIEYIQYLMRYKTPFTMFLIDIDNFKYINDSYGHLCGDEILIHVTEEISRAIEDSTGVLSRLGGDEFLVVLENITEYKTIWNIARSFSISCSTNVQKFQSFSSDISVTLTTGIARFPLDALTYEALFNCTDKALYRGKHKGRNCFIIYNAEIHAKINIRNIKSNYTTTNIIKIVYDFLTVADRRLDFKIHSLFEFLCQYLGIDSICLNTNKGMEHHLTNGKIIKIAPISNSQYQKMKTLDDVVIMNHRNNLEEVNSDMYDIVMEQDIRSFIAFECKYNYSFYGFLRVDMNRERVWSKDEKDILLVVAKTMGILKNFED